jgi:drug/metabolite transporter (DMT)-like permease
MDQRPDRLPPTGRGAGPKIPGQGPQGLSPVAIGALWLIGSGVSFSIMGALVRYVGETHDVHPFQIAFFRNILVLAPMLLFMGRMNLTLVPPRLGGLYLLRAAVEFLAMLAWLAGVMLLPLGDFTAVSFTSVLFAALAARMVLRERLGPHRLVAIFAGFVGALIILRPGPDGLSLGALAALSTAVSIAASRVAARLLAKTEPASAILFYMMLYTTPLAAIAAAFTWSNPSPAALLPIVAVAIAAGAGHFFIAQAYRSAEVSALAPFDFLQIPIAGLIGFAALGQTPDMVTGIGATIIVGSTLYAVHRARLRSPAPSAAGTTPRPGLSP